VEAPPFKDEVGSAVCFGWFVCKDSPLDESPQFLKLPCLFFLQTVELSNQVSKILAAVDEKPE